MKGRGLAAAALMTLALLAHAAASPQEAPPPPAVAAPGDPNGLVSRARALLKDDKYEEALDVAGSAVDAWPAHAPAFAVLGDAQYRRGDFVPAEKSYRRALELNPDEAAAHFGVGRILRTLGRYPDAASSFSRAAALAPSTPKYLRVLANHLARREDELGMLRRYLELSREHPEDAEEKAIVDNVASWIELLARMGDQPLGEVVKREPIAVPIQVVRGQAYLKMSVAGLKDQRLVFDTGATGLTISHRIASRAKLIPIRPFTIAGTGTGRLETGDLVVVPEVALGDGVVIRNLPATVRDPTGPEEGLIGPSTFALFDITIDLKERRLSLDAPGGTARPGTVEPFRNVGGEIVIAAGVNGQPLNAMVDTGSASDSRLMCVLRTRSLR